ncbi:MAG: DUF262 domain-containing protein [Bacteroidaceae bacterium]|nr:DUF262 domain-containing protein [Bacteroidaceae bacterium]
MSNLTLSITSIGDLLLRETITNGGEPIKDVNLCVPIYQRPYKWTARNAIQLLDDIIDAKNRNKERYRVGTLILHQTNNRYDIVDGQQRAITFSLLLSALGEKNIAFLQQEIYDNEFNNHNIANNYNALYRRVGLKSEESELAVEHQREMERLKEYIENRCELIVVITPDISEAFQFFDSQNARGKALYPHDLLKAYHLREMNDISEDETEKIVRGWEQVSQRGLADFFGNYLYRIKEWVNGNKATVLNEHNIHIFKGITRSARTPYAQFYKSAYCYADMVNSSAMPFVSGTQNVNAFQLNTPVIAGKPFFEYTKHYYNILKDIQNNNKYEGFYINDNIIVKTLDRHFKRGKGNSITRLLFDTSVLLYVDRFCPEAYPTKEDMELFEQFVVYAFIWAYSLRAQYTNLGWLSAQNYIMGLSDKINAFNMYQLISNQDTPTSLLSALADKLNPLSNGDIKDGWARECYEYSGSGKTLKSLRDENDGVYENYLYFFQINGFYKN